MDAIEQYAQYFTNGLKVTVCIPMDNNETFRDWGTAGLLDKDILTLQLSRDGYSGSVHLVSGIVLDLRIGVGDAGYRCSGILIDAEEDGFIRVILTGDIAEAAPREYFRLDTFIPFRYEFSDEQNLDVLIGKWRTRKQATLVHTAERRAALIESHRESLLRTVIDEADPEWREQLTKNQQYVDAYSDIDESWNSVIAYIINLSAGGFKFTTSDDFEIDELVFMELFIPVYPPRIVDTVARVVSKTKNNGIKEEGKQFYNIAVHFVLIDDRDRDVIVNHILQVETMRIRQKGQAPVYQSAKQNALLTPLQKGIAALLLILMILCFSYFQYKYSIHDIRNEIEGIFGDAFRQYRDMRGGQQ